MESASKLLEVSVTPAAPACAQCSRSGQLGMRIDSHRFRHEAEAARQLDASLSRRTFENILANGTQMLAVSESLACVTYRVS